MQDIAQIMCRQMDRLGGELDRDSGCLHAGWDGMLEVKRLHARGGVLDVAHRWRVGIR
jgi:hypothetical protein